MKESPSTVVGFIAQTRSDTLTRRQVLRSVALAGGATALASLLAACGGGSSPAATSGTSSGSSAAANAPTAIPTRAPLSTVAASSATSGTSTSATASPGTQAQGKPGGQIKIGWGSFQTHDPHVTSSISDNLFIMAVYDRLVELTPDGKLYPGLATEWTTSPDGLVWTFKLRKGVKFHDGTPFNAEAVKFNFDRIVDPATKSQYAVFILGPYDSSAIVDEYTVQLKMKSPYGRLLSALASLGLGMVSPAAVKKYGAEFAQHPVGTGPFIFKEEVEKDHLTLVRNPDYNWAAALHNHQGPAYLDQVTIQFITESGTKNAALLSGQINVGGGVATSDFVKLEKNANYTTHKYLVSGYPPAGHFINVKKAPTDDVNVRKAILYGLDFKTLNEAVFDGTAIPANSLVSTFSWSYDPEVGKLYQFDQAKANSLLEQAGWKKSGDYRTKNGQTLTLGYTTFTTLKVLAEAVQAQLKEVGFKVDITAEEYPPYQQDTQSGKHNIAWTQWSGVDPGDLHKIFGSENIGSGWNLSHYKNDNIDQWLTQGDAEGDPEKRKAIYKQVQMQVMQDAAYAPLYNYLILWAFQKNVEGVNITDAVGSSPLFYDMYLNT